MESLATQAQFEELWFSKDTRQQWIVYFTAAWCGPCKLLDTDAIAKAAQEKGIPIYKCDETVNDYTSGYCGIRTFPTFVLFNPKKVCDTVSSNDTRIIIDWIARM